MHVFNPKLNLSIEQLQALSKGEYTLKNLPHKFTSEQIMKILEPLNIHEFYDELCEINSQEYLNSEEPTETMITTAFRNLCMAWSKYICSAAKHCKTRKSNYDTYLKEALVSYMVSPKVAETLLVPYWYFYGENNKGSIDFNKPKT